MTDFVLPGGTPVVLTPAAIQHFESIATGKTVIFGVEGGGCAGFQYFWKIVENNDQAIHSDDEIIEFDQFHFAVDGASLMFVTGSKIDYITSITGSHIDIDNPLAKAGCGCGVSINF